LAFDFLGERRSPARDEGYTHPKNLMHDLLQLLESDDRSRERFVELVKPFVAAIAAWICKAAPMMRRVAQAVERLENAPPVKGYEPLLLADGYDPLEARLFAAVILRTGQRLHQEKLAEQRLAGAIAALGDAQGRGSLLISRRAKKLGEALGPSVEVSLREAWAMAGLPHSFNLLEKLVAMAMDREADACQRLTEIARALRPELRDSRGRVPSLESATHEAFLALREKGAYTYDDVSGDMTDAATRATRVAMNAPNFDPRPAQRRQRRRQARQQH
jgi:hypothetical protein